MLSQNGLALSFGGDGWVAKEIETSVHCSSMEMIDHVCTIRAHTSRDASNGIKAKGQTDGRTKGNPISPFRNKIDVTDGLADEQRLSKGSSNISNGF